ncbi:MAG: hypothetical protein LAT51_10115 [Flavobacteriaceae bacterium]|nr:hypothetical protein [Flavobacteriaceae bacterium]
MNKKEQKELLKAFKVYAEKVLASKKESKKFLIKTGIHTEKGKLTKPYAS